jgi:vacuolar-type H+-ATPase subunit H
VSSSDRPARRREIEDSTAARLAEIVAAAEQAAKQVIDEAEAEARERISDAHEEAERIVAERLAGLAELTEELGAQADALRRQAETLQRAIAEAKADLGGGDSFGGPSPGRHASDPDPEPARRPPGPSLKVVGSVAREEPAGDETIGTPAGARLLATQMAVSGSSRAEIEGRLRDGFAINDTRAILDAILGPEQ